MRTCPARAEWRGNEPGCAREALPLRFRRDGSVLRSRPRRQLRFDRQLLCPAVDFVLRPRHSLYFGVFECVVAGPCGSLRWRRHRPCPGGDFRLASSTSGGTQGRENGPKFMDRPFRCEWFRDPSRSARPGFGIRRPARAHIWPDCSDRAPDCDRDRRPRRGDGGGSE